MPKVEKSVRDILKNKFNLTMATRAFRFCDVKFTSFQTTNPNNLDDILIGVYAYKDSDKDKDVNQIAPLFQHTRYQMIMTKADGTQVPVSAIQYDGQKTDIIHNNPWASTLAVFSVPFADYSEAQSIDLRVRTSEASRQCDISVVAPMPKKSSRKTQKPTCQ